MFSSVALCDYSTNNEQYIDDEKQVYPVVYLKDSVVITKGSGTKTDPYIVE